MSHSRTISRMNSLINCARSSGVSSETHRIVFRSSTETSLWELGKIALKLKPEIEAKAKANQSAAGGDKFGEKPLSATLPEAVSSVDTRKELAEAVGLGERTMGKDRKSVV